MKEYQKYEYCIAVGCNQIDINGSGIPNDKEICKNHCEAWSFHNYLQEQGYKIIKEDKEHYCGSVDHFIQGVN